MPMPYFSENLTTVRLWSKKELSYTTTSSSLCLTKEEY